jgi:hypothetical protein
MQGHCSVLVLDPLARMYTLGYNKFGEVFMGGTIAFMLRNLALLACFMSGVG